ncbi:hypothetical protein XH86_27670 [Bradyrhizobium guangdongense]|uniref:Uncharacterized protein n=1 Tax=Bradyrhizobium guangdongense TaxID=1325090 RepID=A0A7S7V8Q1_9BRAD|nr:hypothetical protein XH86_27670 [Bradyrhizobium guangdongense]
MPLDLPHGMLGQMLVQFGCGQRLRIRSASILGGATITTSGTFWASSVWCASDSRPPISARLLLGPSALSLG